jgi:hypothetical protein
MVARSSGQDYELCGQTFFLPFIDIWVKLNKKGKIPIG